MPTPITEAYSHDIIEKGRALLKDKRQMRFKREELGSGILQLSASYFDHFNFVDHAKVAIDTNGMKVLSSSCDCPETQRGAAFCTHRAALLSTIYEEEPAEQKNIVRGDDQPLEPVSTDDEPVSDAENGRSIDDYTFKFCNSARDLYPFTKNPEIPLERFEYIFGKNERARRLYAWHGKWGGSCFGIAAASGMFNFDDNDVFVQDYKANAACPHDLDLSDMHKDLSIRLHTFIEAAHIIQFDYKALAEEEKVRAMPLGDRLKLLCDRVEAFDKEGNHPVLMDVFGKIGGHAVLPFKLEKIDQTKRRLHIYDSNWPNQVRFCDLTTDALGNYLSWRFPMFGDTVFSSETGEDITLTRDEDIQAAWENRASASSTGIAMFATPGNNVAVRNEEGDVIRLKNGEAVVVGDGVIPIYPKFGGITVDPVHSFYLPAGAYQVENLDSEEDLSFDFSEIERSLEVETEARTVEICLRDADGIVEAAISEPEKRFSICLNDPEKRTVLQGVSSEKRAKATLNCGELKLHGLEANKVFSLRINNADVTARNYIVEDAPEIIYNSDVEEKQT